MAIDITDMCPHLQRKLFVLAGKSAPKIIREDKLAELLF